MYIYPENLTAKPMLWLWTLKDLAISGSLLLFGFILAAEFGGVLLLVLGATHAFLTIRAEGTSIADTIRYAACFLFGQQLYLWGLAPEMR